MRFGTRAMATCDLLSEAMELYFGNKSVTVFDLLDCVTQRYIALFASEFVPPEVLCHWAQ